MHTYSPTGGGGLAERQATLLIKAPAGLQRSSRVAEEFSDTVLCEHGRVGQTALDGVAGDGVCQDLRVGTGWGRGPDSQECWPETGRSRLQHLLSARFRRCTVELRHMFPTDEAQIERAEQRIKDPGGKGALAAYRGEGSG